MKVTTLGFCASIYVPTTIGGNVDINTGMKNATNIANTLASLFGGSNMKQVNGFYKPESGEIINETNFVVSCFVSESNRNSLLNTLERVALSLCERMQQECVAIEYNGSMYLISE